MSEIPVDPDFPPDDPIPPDYPEPEPGPELPVADGWTEAEISGARVNVFDAPIVAGDPAGARIEIRSTGFHAFNGVGTETAHIDGAEGVFVGGEFRTSDDLPGQVTLADDAYRPSWAAVGTAFPGIRVDPIDASTTAIPAGIGAYGDGVIVDGGKATTGGSSYIVANPHVSYMQVLREDGTTGGEIQTRPTASLMQTYREDGTTGGVMQTSPTASLMRTYHADGSPAGEIQTRQTESYMRTYREDGSAGGSIQTSPTASLMQTYHANGEVGGVIQTSPTASMMRTRRADGGLAAEIQTSPTDSRMRTYGADGANGWVQVLPNSAELASVSTLNTYTSRIRANETEAHLFTVAGGVSRYLSVDADGVWVKTNAGGTWKHINLELAAEVTPWVTVPLNTGWAPRTTGGYFPGLRVRRNGQSLELNGAVQGGASGSVIGTIPDTALRPPQATFVVSTLATDGLGQCHVSTTGNITHSYGANAPAFLALNVSIPLS